MWTIWSQFTEIAELLGRAARRESVLADPAGPVVHKHEQRPFRIRRGRHRLHGQLTELELEPLADLEPDVR